MAVEAFDAPLALRRLITEGAISEEGLHTITGVERDAVRSFVYAGHSETGLTSTQPALSGEESTRLSILAAQLTDGMAIPDDERLKAILESLTNQVTLTPENISQLTGIDISEVEAVLSDPQSIPFGQRYEIAIRTSYLVTAFNSAASK